jgi:hypothetical protein
MKNDLKKAMELLKEGGYTCVLCRGAKSCTSTERGVKPLFGWLRSGADLKGYCAADKVVGKAAAFLYVLLGVEQVYAEVMSQKAIDVLDRFGIEAFCDEAPETIRNRDNTGMCPMEKTVLEIEQPMEALQAVERKLAELRGAQTALKE